jgi:alpha-beta hydrolase superfamily lysophospholipase
MPQRFQPEQLRESLRPLATGSALTPEQQAYQAFYGIDMPGVQTRLGCFQIVGYQVAVQVWWPEQPRATLIFQHGYYDHMGLYRHVIQWALNMGFAVLACDLPGHGLSSGARADIGEFSDYQRVLQGVFAQAEQLDLPQPWHLCGQSAGGAVMLEHLLLGEVSDKIGQSILLAPLVRPRAWGWSKFSYQMLKPFVSSIPRRFNANSNDPDFLEFIQRDPLQPLSLPTAWVGALSRWVPKIEAAPRSRRSPLIIQGDDDMTVDWRHNMQVLNDKFSAPQLLMLPQARHHLVNETPEFRSRYFDFLSERLG